jgi:hypothetical protein
MVDEKARNSNLVEDFALHVEALSSFSIQGHSLP